MESSVQTVACETVQDQSERRGADGGVGVGEKGVEGVEGDVGFGWAVSLRWRGLGEGRWWNWRSCIG